MFTFSVTDFEYIMKRADDDFKSVIVFSKLGNQVSVNPANGRTRDDVENAFNGLIVDSLDTDEESTQDTEQLELIWDEYFVKD